MLVDGWTDQNGKIESICLKYKLDDEKEDFIDDDSEKDETIIFED